jgi:hypothetical protein
MNRRKTYVEIDRNNASNRLTTQYFHDSRSNPVFEINAEGHVLSIANDPGEIEDLSNVVAV